MHFLVVTIFYCVDNHFTSFVAILLLLTMNFIILYMQYMGKQLVRSAIGIGFFLNNADIGKQKNLISVHLYLKFGKGSIWL